MNTRRINAEQRERLLDLVEKNRTLLFGFKTQGNAVKSQIWRDIKFVLNKLGSEKSVDQWKKTWTDIKSTVKKKAAELKAINTTYGSDFPSDMQLSEEDYQVLRICDIRIMDGITKPSGALSSLRQINSNQREVMLKMLEENVSVFCGPNTQEKVEKWSALTVTLNTLGPKKSNGHWRKIWVDMKKAVKRKAANNNAAGVIGKLNDEDLTEEDLRVMRIYEAEALECSQSVNETSEAVCDETSLQSMEMQIENSSIYSLSSVKSSPESSQHQVEMENLQWINHSDTIMNFQKSLMNDVHSCDTTLAFRGKSVKAHRFILSSCSTLLRELLKDVPIGQEATIVVPDFDGSLLDTILNFMYTGETSISSSRLTEFLEVIGNLGIKNPININCGNISVSCQESTNDIVDEQVEVEDEVTTEIIEVVDEMKQKPIVAEDEENLAIVDHSNINQHNLTDGSDDDSFTVDNQDFFIKSSIISKDNSSTESNELDALAEHLDVDSPMTEVYVDDPIGESKQDDDNLLEVKKEIIDNDDILDDISEPQTFRDKVNRLRAKQKKSLRSAFLAHQQGMSLQKAAIKYNASHVALSRQLAKHQTPMNLEIPLKKSKKK